MRSSCVANPANDPLIVVRRWQVVMCGGNHCAASLLGFFSYWHDVRLSQREKAAQQNDTAEKHGERGVQDVSLYQFHTTEQLRAGILDLYGEGAIRKARALLVELGVITEHKNPNPRYHFDATTHFLFHPEVVNEWLESYEDGVFSPSTAPVSDSSKVSDPARESAHTSLESAQRALENKGAIHKTTSKTTGKEIALTTSAGGAAAPGAFDFGKWPAPPSDAVWADFVKHRKAKRAPLTQAAIDGLGKEIAKAAHMGFTPDGCLTECMTRGWAAVKADWLQPKHGNGNTNRQQDNDAKTDELMALLGHGQAGGLFGGDIIDMEPTNDPR